MAVQETLKRRTSPSAQMLRLYEWCRVKQKEGAARAAAAAALAKSSNKFRRVEKVEPVIAVRVRCHGKLHRITSMAGGRLTIHDHTPEEQKAFNTLQKMGADLPRCMVLQKLMAKKPTLMEEERKGIPGELIPHFTLRRVVHSRRWHAYPNLPVPPLKDRLTAKKNNDEALMRGVAWKAMLNYPNMHEVRAGFATQQISPGVDIRHVFGVDSRANLVMAGTEIVAALPRAWPRWYQQGLGILSGHLVTRVEFHSATIASVDVAEFDQTQQRIVLVPRTARIAEDNNWRLV